MSVSIASTVVSLTKPQTKKRTIKRNDLVQPFLKWAGGKRQLVSKIRECVPRKFGLYFEPFLGAGAVLFDLQPSRARINDANQELINCYNVIKTNPEGLITHAREHSNTESYYYTLRSLDREPTFAALSPLERASRIIFLNKTCYNGLFRVNSQGQFNVPFGNYTNPSIVDEVIIRAVSQYLNEANIEISSEDFEAALRDAKRGDFVYLDPPYDPLSDTSSFTAYNLNTFDQDEQRRLKEVCDELHARGCRILQSNSNTSLIRTLYSDTSKYTLVKVGANRNINSVATSRGKINELLIFNSYDVGPV
jgi:DNA adenine methylase